METIKTIQVYKGNQEIIIFLYNDLYNYYFIENGSNTLHLISDNIEPLTDINEEGSIHILDSITLDKLIYNSYELLTIIESLNF